MIGKKKQAPLLKNVAGLLGHFEALLRGDKRDLDAYLESVTVNEKIVQTQATLHCHAVRLDGNSMPRVKDLARALAFRITDYAIPRSEILAAQNYDQKNNTTAKTSELRAKAKSLFTTISNTGEGGEMLLYMLTQTFLGIPQIFCKMPLKTNSKLHYNGADGIHGAVDAVTGRVALYWGESKLYKTVDKGISECLESIRPFLCSSGATGAPQERDLQLVRSNIDLNNPVLQKAILRYLDPDDPHFNKLQYRGVCLVGFDCKSYPKKPNSQVASGLAAELKNSIAEWSSKLGKGISERSPLESVELQVFLLPFPSVAKFREAFLHEVKNA